MKMNNEVIWQDAEKLAQLINEARKNIKSHDKSWERLWEGENALKSIEEITNCDKQKFIGKCADIGKFMPKDDNFSRIVKDVMGLQQESIAEDKDISFEMFQTCLGFHLAIYKREWKENDTLDEN